MDTTETKGENVKNHSSISHADSTKSVDEILKYLESNNFTAFRHYCKLLGRRPPTSQLPHYITVGHPISTFPDEWDGMLPTGYFEKFTYKSSYPKPITPMCNIDGTDPVTDLMNKKMAWEKTAVQYNLSVGVHKESGENFEVQRINEEVAVCSSFVVDAAVHQELNPDPNFSYAYNWYYGGHGNMHIISLGGSEYILQSVLNCLFLSKFSKEQINIDQNHIFQYDCGKDTFILETIHSDNNLVALRLKNRVIILKIIILAGSIQIRKLKEIQNDLPYTSISFDSHHKNILYVTTLDNTLSIVNLDLMKRRTVKLPETKNITNNWSMVDGCDQNTYAHVARKAISVYDKRTNGIVQSWSDIVNVSDTRCNQISAAKMCQDIPYMYVGTDHHLFLMDLRCFGKNAPTPVQRWTHNMLCQPTNMSLCKFEVNKDLLCFSSQLAFEDLRILQNDSECFYRGAPVTSISMLYRPPTLEHALNMARQTKKLCLDILNPLETRIFTAATGTAVVECGEKYLILTQSSLGDIFCHTLYPDHLTIEDDGLERLHEWGKANKQKLKAIKFDKIVDISFVWRSLKKIPKSHTYGWQKLSPEEEFNYSEQEVIDTFESGKLDKGLWEAWKNDQDEQTDLRPESLAINLHFSDSE